MQVDLEPTRSGLEADPHVLWPIYDVARDLQRSGASHGFFFIRKEPGYRVRISVRARRYHEVHAAVARSARRLRRSGELRTFRRAAYAPEAYQFGGPAAMPHVHRYFCEDSALIVTRQQLEAEGASPPSAEVLSLAALNDLLGCWIGDAQEEVWDVWCNLAAMHGFAVVPERDRALPVLTLETLRSHVATGTEAVLRRYQHANRRLVTGLAREAGAGRLLYSPRLIAPFLVAFHWNRLLLSIPKRQQLCAGMIAALDPKRFLRVRPLGDPSGELPNGS